MKKWTKRKFEFFLKKDKKCLANNVEMTKLQNFKAKLQNLMIKLQNIDANLQNVKRKMKMEL
jgi:thiaminase